MDAAELATSCCPLCGARAGDEEETIIKRGAITVAFDPITIWWRNIAVPFSRVESHLFAVIARRGRVSFDELDDALQQMNASPSTRPVVLGHIRSKLQNLGACNPFERLGKDIIRLRVDADERGSVQATIGLTQPRYARV